MRPFPVNEVIVFSNDRTNLMKNVPGGENLTTTEFFVKNLEYQETP